MHMMDGLMACFSHPLLQLRKRQLPTRVATSSSAWTSWRWLTKSLKFTLVCRLRSINFSETFIIFPPCLHVVVVVVPMAATTSTIITFLLFSASTGVSQVFVHLQIWGLGEAKARFLINQSSACGIYPSWKPRWLLREWLWGLPGAERCWEIDGC